MSFDLVDQASRSPAFDPTPQPESLAAAHVPFQVLADNDIEGRITASLNQFGRISLVGPSGSGKSSLARYVVRPNGQELAPIWVNVATEDHEKIATVRGFLEILGNQLLAKARRAGEINEQKRRELLRQVQQTEPLGREEAKLRAQLGGSYWLLRGDVAREVSRAFDYGSAYRSTDDMRDATAAALAGVTASDLTPVLVADDTDRLLKIGGDPALSEKLFLGFFGEVLREISERLECGLLVAAHDEYVTRQDYVDLTTGRLSDVPLPTLDQREQFGRLITARVEFLDEQASWRDVVESPVLDRLSELHLGPHKRSVRVTLTSLREALALAASQGAELVTVLHLDAAAAA